MVQTRYGNKSFTGLVLVMHSRGMDVRYKCTGSSSLIDGAQWSGWTRCSEASIKLHRLLTMFITAPKFGARRCCGEVKLWFAYLQVTVIDSHKTVLVLINAWREPPGGRHAGSWMGLYREVLVPVTGALSNSSRNPSHSTGCT
jgi:hypothetical protein